MNDLFKLTFEAKDKHHIYRLEMYPEAKVYTYRVVEESDAYSIFLDDYSDMKELEIRLFSNGYKYSKIA